MALSGLLPLGSFFLHLNHCFSEVHPYFFNKPSLGLPDPLGLQKTLPSLSFPNIPVTEDTLGR